MRNSKKGVSLVIAVMVTTVLFIFVAAITAVAMFTSSMTISDITKNEAYINAKSALAAAESYYIESKILPDEEYFCLTSDDGTMTSSSANAVEIKDKTKATEAQNHETYVKAEYDDTNNKFVLTAYAKYFNNSMEKTTSVEVECEYTVGYDADSRITTAIRKVDVVDPLRYVTIHVKPSPDSTLDPPYLYTWGFGTGQEDRVPGDKGIPDEKSETLLTLDWIDKGDDRGPQCAMTYEGNGWYYYTIAVSDENLNYFNAIISSKGGTRTYKQHKYGDPNYVDPADYQTSEMFNLPIPTEPGGREDIYIELNYNEYGEKIRDNGTVFYNEHYDFKDFLEKTLNDKGETPNALTEYYTTYTKADYTVVKFRVSESTTQSWLQDATFTVTNKDGTPILDNNTLGVFDAVRIKQSGGADTYSTTYTGAGVDLTYEGYGWYRVTIPTTADFNLVLNRHDANARTYTFNDISGGTDDEVCIVIPTSSGANAYVRSNEDDANELFKVLGDEKADLYTTVNIKGLGLEGEGSADTAPQVNMGYYSEHITTDQTDPPIDRPYVVYLNYDLVTAYEAYSGVEGGTVILVEPQEVVGEEFLGWKLRGSTDGKVYEAGELYTVLASDVNADDRTIIFDAIWEVTGYGISYNSSGGGTAPPDTKVSDLTDGIIAMQSPMIKPGYRFLGWSSIQNATTPEDKYAPNSIITLIDLKGILGTNETVLKLYAVWEKIETQYLLSYDANGGKGTLPTSVAVSVDGNRIVEVKNGQLYRTDGKMFIGWSTAINSPTAQYVAGDKITLDGDMTLYAVWSDYTYSVAFDKNTSAKVDDMPANSIGLELNSNYTVPNNVPTRTGYTFVGWNTNKTLTTAEYKAGDIITVDKNVKLYAIWSQDTQSTSSSINGMSTGLMSSNFFNTLSFGISSTPTYLDMSSSHVEYQNGFGASTSLNALATTDDNSTSSSNVTVYFEMPSSDWAKPYIYYWGGSSSTGWPGLDMAKVSGTTNIYSLMIPSDTTDVIFNNGKDSHQTEDLPFKGGNKIFKITSGTTGGSLTGEWEDYVPPTNGLINVAMASNRGTQVQWYNIFMNEKADGNDNISSYDAGQNYGHADKRAGNSETRYYDSWYSYKIPTVSEYTVEFDGVSDLASSQKTVQLEALTGDVWITIDTTNESGGELNDLSIYTFDPDSNYATGSTRIYIDNIPTGWNKEVYYTTWGLNDKAPLQKAEFDPVVEKWYIPEVNSNSPYMTFYDRNDVNTENKTGTISLEGMEDFVSYNLTTEKWEYFIHPTVQLERAIQELVAARNISTVDKNKDNKNGEKVSFSKLTSLESSAKTALTGFENQIASYESKYETSNVSQADKNAMEALRTAMENDILEIENYISSVNMFTKNLRESRTYLEGYIEYDLYGTATAEIQYTTASVAGLKKVHDEAMKLYENGSITSSAIQNMAYELREYMDSSLEVDLLKTNGFLGEMQGDQAVIVLKDEANWMPSESVKGSVEGLIYEDRNGSRVFAQEVNEKLKYVNSQGYHLYYITFTDTRDTADFKFNPPSGVIDTSQMVTGITAGEVWVYDNSKDTWEQNDQDGIKVVTANSITGYVGDQKIYTPDEMGSDFILYFNNDTKVQYTDYYYSSSVEIKFTNNLNWDTVNAYFFVGKTTVGEAWPGTKMTYFENNTSSQDVYKIDIPSGATHVIFNNGSEQTVDINLTNFEGFWLNGSQTDGKYNATGWGSTSIGATPPATSDEAKNIVIINPPSDTTPSLLYKTDKNSSWTTATMTSSGSNGKRYYFSYTGDDIITEVKFKIGSVETGVKNITGSGMGEVCYDASPTSGKWSYEMSEYTILAGAYQISASQFANGINLFSTKGKYFLTSSTFVAPVSTVDTKDGSQVGWTTTDGKSLTSSVILPDASLTSKTVNLFVGVDLKVHQGAHIVYDDVSSADSTVALSDAGEIHNLTGEDQGEFVDNSSYKAAEINFRWADDSFLNLTNTDIKMSSKVMTFACKDIYMTLSNSGVNTSEFMIGDELNTGVNMVTFLTDVSVNVYNADGTLNENKSFIIYNGKYEIKGNIDIFEFDKIYKGSNGVSGSKGDIVRVGDALISGGVYK